MTSPRLTLVFVALCPALYGCVSHIAPYKSKHRHFDEGDYAAVAPLSSSNSLFATAKRGLVEDERARAVGDLIVITLDESNSAEHKATTALSKSNASNIGMSGGLVDALQKVVPAVALQNLLGLTSGSTFSGAGNTTRSGQLSGSLPVRVRKVLPNDDLYVEGSKVVMVGAEEHHLYVSGVIRQVDVLPNGSVSSSLIADAEIEYTGRGDISDYQRPGWLQRVLNKVGPF